MRHPCVAWEGHTGVKAQAYHGPRLVSGGGRFFTIRRCRTKKVIIPFRVMDDVMTSSVTIRRTSSERG